jgi:2-oxoglutarate dehydrogenase E1 component
MPLNVDASNREYIDQLYQQYQADPSSVDEDWGAFFQGFELGYGRADERDEAEESAAESASAEVAPAGSERRYLERTDTGAVAVVEAYRQYGHYAANLDPLGGSSTEHPLLQLSEFELSDADLDKGVGMGGFHHQTDGSLRDLLGKLKKTYCGTHGVDYLSITDKGQRRWLEEKIEPILNQPELTKAQKRRILWLVTESEGFEQFLQKRYLGQKRFSVEGGESLLPLLDRLVETGSHLGIEEMIIGMAHRGRLNVLAHLLHKQYESILSEFEGATRSEGSEDEGDVKYHQGYSYDFVTRRGGRVHLSLSYNPSHLELVNPVIEGMVQAKQDYLHDEERSRVVPIQIHGEAAFTGQGIVAETLNLSQLEGYRTGGTIHIIINNQLGYTATPEETRFTTYPTDVARQVQAPVFHVNADDPEAVVHAAELAIQFRQQFKTSVLIDLVCYRRHGHNEADDPTMTSPLMYQKIKSHPSVTELYSKALIERGEGTADDLKEMQEEVATTLDRSQEKARRLKVKPRTNTFGGMWQGMTWPRDDWEADTSVDASRLKKIADKATEIPDGFTMHPTVKRIMASRQEMAAGKIPIDWGCAEMLAFGSLVIERLGVRLAGQDSQRGTFAHRHAVWHDTKTGQCHTPLAHMAPDQGGFEVYNTMLSELAVLGFEYGISRTDPRRLVIWEAQFGDFANGAQLVIDQYISSAEAKWHRMAGIVLLLPHGCEGMGPEHSSARLERHLQLCAKNNMQVCYPSTPAQIFHVLRRQMERNFRKPLIVMTPKSLLRHKQCVSQLAELTQGGYRNVIDDTEVTAASVRRVALCSGKVYYDLLAGREESQAEDVALVRIEQLYPFPLRELAEVLHRYEAAEEYVWVQEEASNMGAWYFVQPLIDDLLGERDNVRYIGRDEAASPAVGDARQHQSEQQEIVEQTLDLGVKELKLEDAQRTRSAAAGSGAGD